MNIKIIDIRNNVDILNKTCNLVSLETGNSRGSVFRMYEVLCRWKYEYGHYLCIDRDTIVGGLSVIENDFRNRPDLLPNICTVYAEEKYR